MEQEKAFFNAKEVADTGKVVINYMINRRDLEKKISVEDL